jgi:hypothetical protein
MQTAFNRSELHVPGGDPRGKAGCGNESRVNRGPARPVRSQPVPAGSVPPKDDRAGPGKPTLDSVAGGPRLS